MNFIVALFEAIFGHKHWTFRCFVRSTIASFLFIIALNLIFYRKYPHIYDLYAFSINWVGHLQFGVWIIVVGQTVVFILVSCFPDYLSLYKARLILNAMTREPTLTKVFWFMCLDLLGSITLSIVAYICVQRFVEPSFAKTLVDVFTMVGSGLNTLIGRSEDQTALFNIVFVLSTMMTSLWTILIIMAVIVLKAIRRPVNYMMRIVRWGFDVDSYPVRVIGLVSAAIVWVGTVVYGTL